MRNIDLHEDLQWTPIIVYMKTKAKKSFLGFQFATKELSELLSGPKKTKDEETNEFREDSITASSRTIRPRLT